MRLLILNGDLPVFPGWGGVEYLHTTRLARLAQRVGLVSLAHTPLPPLVAFSAAIQSEQRELQQFLRLNLYQHYRVARMTKKARRIVTELFGAFMAEPQLLPPQYRDQAVAEPARTVADFIAGMTDRYAIREYRRLFAVEAI